MHELCRYLIPGLYTSIASPKCKPTIFKQERSQESPQGESDRRRQQPSHKPLIFELFKRAPEARPYSLKISSTFTMPYEFVMIQVLSSAYCEIFTSRPPGMWKPLISALFQIACAKTSATSTNSKGDKGHPLERCRDIPVR